MTDGSKPTVDRKPRTRTIVNARRAIADFVESNAPRMNDWLERVAEGIPKRDADGRKLIDTQGSVVYVVKPDPATAVKLVSELCEYHLPKLSRSDVAVVAQVENLHNADLRQLTNEQINHRILELIGFNLNGDVLDVEAVKVSEPNK